MTNVLEPKAVRQAVADSVPNAFRELNLKAFDKGFEYGKQHLSAKLETEREKTPSKQRQALNVARLTLKWPQQSSSYERLSSEFLDGAPLHRLRQTLVCNVLCQGTTFSRALSPHKCRALAPV